MKSLSCWHHFAFQPSPVPTISISPEVKKRLEFLVKKPKTS